MATEARAHPVRLVVTDDLHRSRLTVFFRLLLAIPHFFWLGLFAIGALFVGFINWWATLITGTSPKGLHDFLAGFIRYATQLFAYVFLAANPYPAFYLGSDQSAYPIDVHIDPPERQNRWVTGFRVFLALPALLLSGMLSGGGSVSSGGRGLSVGGVMGLASILSWFSAMVRGRSPRGLRDFSAWALAYTAQFYAYLFLVTDRYPNSHPLVFLDEASWSLPRRRAGRRSSAPTTSAAPGCQSSSGSRSRSRTSSGSCSGRSSRTWPRSRTGSSRSSQAGRRDRSRASCPRTSVTART